MTNSVRLVSDFGLCHSFVICHLGFVILGVRLVISFTWTKTYIPCLCPNETLPPTHRPNSTSSKENWCRCGNRLSASVRTRKPSWSYRPCPSTRLTRRG